MKTLELIGVDNTVYHEVLDNGLNVYLIPFEKKKNYYINYMINFGSSVLEFKYEGKMKKVNPGVAHFLEHKVFEQENGMDPFQFYDKSGTECNAATGYTTTKYYLFGSNAIEENLEFLLNFVNTPYFTDENVEKEKGIIIEELKMYKDNPIWKLGDQNGKSLFHKHPIKIDIGGTEASVKKITKEELYACYDTFYHPSNASLFISGQFDKERMLSIIKNNESLKKKGPVRTIEKKQIKEEYSVCQKYSKKEIKGLEITKLILSFKLSLKEYKEDLLEYYLYSGIILSTLFGNSSLFREKMQKTKTMISLYYSRMQVDDFDIITFESETNCPDELAEKVVDTLKKTPISKEEFERYKKVWLSSGILISDSIQATTHDLMEDLIDLKRIVPEKQEVIKKLNYEKMLKVRETLDFDNHSIVIGVPKV